MKLTFCLDQGSSGFASNLNSKHFSRKNMVVLKKVFLQTFFNVHKGISLNLYRVVFRLLSLFHFSTLSQQKHSNVKSKRAHPKTLDFTKVTKYD